MIELFFLSVMLSVMLDKVAPLKLMVLASILVVNSKIKLYKERNDIHIQGTLPDFVSVELENTYSSLPVHVETCTDSVAFMCSRMIRSYYELYNILCLWEMEVKGKEEKNSILCFNRKTSV